MLLEIKVFGSAEWYEKAIPVIEEMGFHEVAELAWADPETDGELSGHYYDYSGKENIPFSHFVETIQEIERIVMEGEAPYIKLSMAKDPREA